MKFILFVEGQTEEKALPKFLKKWLDQRLTVPVGIVTVRFNGWAELVKEAPRKARLYLESPQKDEIIAIISLLDIYGPTFYPQDCIDSKQRYDWAKDEIEKKVDLPKFFQFFAVHEVEAWLLSDPAIFPSNISRDFTKKIDYPERVNSDEPPGKLLKRLYSAHKLEYKKVVDGKSLFDKLNPEVAYNKCPRLKELLDKMLKLAN